MQSKSRFLSDRQQTDHGKRCRADDETSEPIPKRLLQSSQSFDDGSKPQFLVGTVQEPLNPSSNAVSAAARKRKTKSLDWDLPRKRTRSISGPAYTPSLIDQWLSLLPQSDEYDPLENPENSADMSQPPTKQSRSTDFSGGRLSQSGDSSNTAFSRDKKYSAYKDGNYSVVLETKGSYMRPFKLGMIDADRRLCEKLLTNVQTIPEDVLFDDNHFSAFHINLRGRSEARIYTDLHPRVMPSVENLSICGRENLNSLIEGHNDPWNKSIPFSGPRPQPDHTFGFKWCNFNAQQRQKLNIEPTKKSYYTAREDIYFPFLTGEVKCGKQSLDLADRPNTHSMTIALRGVVDLYRRLNRTIDVNRRLLGFSISHDDRQARLYAHYPVIDGENTTYWREELKEITFGGNKGKERWECYQFTLNVCELFALPFLERLKSLINDLPNPANRLFGLAATSEDISVQGSQNDTSSVESQDEGLKKPTPSRGLQAELRNMIQGLQRQLEQQKQDSEQQRIEMKEREVLLLRQLEQQRKESEQQRKESEQQRKESEQQRKGSEQQIKELMEMLKQQSAQISQFLYKGG